MVDLAQLEAATSETPAAALTHHVDAVDPTAGRSPEQRGGAGNVGGRAPLFRRLSASPVALGVAVLALAVGGTVASASEPAQAGNESARVLPVSALTGDGGVGTVRGTDTRRGVSRGSDRQARQRASATELKRAAEAQAEERNAALGQLAAKAERTARQMRENARQKREKARQKRENQWVLPVRPSETTATFGETGLWATYHTGLDFDGETGDPIYAVAAGEVTFAGYDGAYGNKTVITLDDGTEIWYCHQTSMNVSEGDQVAADEVIGTVGATGNVTGSHLHLEVRPGGGDPVDPAAALRENGVTP